MINEFTREPEIQVKKSFFDLQHSHTTTADVGEIIPICCMNMVPNDTFEIHSEVFIRTQPMMAPIYNKIRARVDWFFDSWNAMDSTFFESLSRIDQKNTNSRTPVTTQPYTIGALLSDSGAVTHSIQGSYFMPTSILHRLYGGFASFTISSNESNTINYIPDVFNLMYAYPLFGFHRICDKYYQNADLQDNMALGYDIRSWSREITLNNEADDDTDNFTYYSLFSTRYRNFTQDIFTSSKPWVQRFSSPTIDFSAVGNITYDSVNSSLGYTNNSQLTVMTLNGDQLIAEANPVTGEAGTTYPSFNIRANNSSGQDVERNVVATSQASNISGQYGFHNHSIDLDNYSVNVNNLSVVDMNLLRTNMLLQLFLEQFSEVGSRYDQFLLGMYGIAPSNEVLHEPQYLGGYTANVSISDVQQTTPENNSSNSPLGRLAGNGLTSKSGFINKITVKEFGTLYGILSIYPEQVYSQGVNRQHIFTNYYDLFNPMFANMSNQPIYNMELYADVTDSDTDLLGTFGYEGIYDYMRFEQNRASGDFCNDNLSYWLMQRRFYSQPTLTNRFINMQYSVDNFKQVFSVTSAQSFIINADNNIKAYRPIPTVATPKFGVGGV